MSIRWCACGSGTDSVLLRYAHLDGCPCIPALSDTAL